MMKGNKLIDDHVQIAVNLAKYKAHGKFFEIAIDPDKAVSYKEGDLIDIEEVVKAPSIFEDMKKGLPAKDEDLKLVFNTTDANEIIKTILDKGELQFTQKYREELRERKHKKIINLIHRNAIDPKTGLPHPETRIAAAMEEGKVKINDLKRAEDQISDIIKILLPIIPISLEKIVMKILIPSQYSAKLHGRVLAYGKPLQERWLNDGSLLVNVELPAGLQQELMDNLNSLSHGSCSVESVERKKT